MTITTTNPAAVCLNCGIGSLQRIGGLCFSCWHEQPAPEDYDGPDDFWSADEYLDVDDADWG